LKILLATARFVITTIQRKFVYFFVIFFPTVPRSMLSSAVRRKRDGKPKFPEPQLTQPRLQGVAVNVVKSAPAAAETEVIPV